MQKAGLISHSSFLVLLPGLEKGFTLDVITREQLTTVFLSIGPFSAWWLTNEHMTNQVILVQACSWPVRKKSFAKKNWEWRRKQRAMWSTINQWNLNMSQNRLSSQSTCSWTLSQNNEKWNWSRTDLVARYVQHFCVVRLWAAAEENFWYNSFKRCT